MESIIEDHHGVCKAQVPSRNLRAGGRIREGTGEILCWFLFSGQLNHLHVTVRLLLPCFASRGQSGRSGGPRWYGP